VSPLGSDGSAEYHQGKIKINGKLIEVVSCGMNPKEWIMGGDCWIDNRFYPGITPSG
jgi:hypothetical protein